MSMGPFESHIEFDFAMEFEKHLRADLKLEPQVEVSTAWGNFRLDFVVRSEKVIAFECDGLEFHDAHRDELRDAVTLGSGVVDTVYRIPGPVIQFNLPEAMLTISLWEPGLFDERATEVIRRKAEPRTELIVAHFDRRSEASSTVNFNYEIRRRSRDQQQGQGGTYFWRKLYEVALRTKGNLDAVDANITPAMFDRIRKETENQ